MLHSFRRLSLTTTHHVEMELSVIQVNVMGEITPVHAVCLKKLQLGIVHMTLFYCNHFQMTLKTSQMLNLTMKSLEH